LTAATTASAAGDPAGPPPPPAAATAQGRSGDTDGEWPRLKTTELGRRRRVRGGQTDFMCISKQHASRMLLFILIIARADLVGSHVNPLLLPRM
jgi:hypothetical protein